ncbi:MAG: AMP-binding protein [Pseudonocardia sp.]|nr:AMP-binding protein [Pseudonocardia sp.]
MPGLPPLDRRTVLAAYERALDLSPDALAQVDAAGRYTFAESYDRSLRIGGGLRALGVRRAEPVALLLDNSLDLVHTWLGLSLTGAVEVPVNTAYKGRFLSHVLNDSGARTIVVEAGYLPRLAAIADELTTLRTVVVRGSGTLAGLRVVPFDELPAAEPVAPVAVGGADLIAYMYTSGTTGPSKGVLTSHAHAYTYGSREDFLAPTPEDRILVTLPLFHLAGQWAGVYTGLIHRAACFVEPQFSVSRFWDTVREHGITLTSMLGTIAQLLAQAPPRPDDADNPLRQAGMSPLPGDIDAFRARFGVEATTAYGMSEIGAVILGPPDRIRPAQAGFAREGYDLRIVDSEGRDVETGQVGELIVRPELRETVMAGYHGLPEKTAEMWRDGWLHTGDAFSQDDEGRFYFKDRMKDALRRRGENVSSFEVERAVDEYPPVAESAVVAVPSELAEDEIKAVVVLREGASFDPAAFDPAELIAFLVDRMPYFMVPRYVEVVDALPRTPTQKVQKAVLRDNPTGTVWDREAAGIVVGRHS